MSEIAIIGSGASAAAAHFSLIEAGFDRNQIAIYTHDKTDIRITPDDSSLMLKFDKSVLQADINIGISSKLQHGIAGASELGGWTNYWGATTFEWPTTLTENKEIFQHSPAYFYGAIERMMQINIKNLKYRNRLIDELEKLKSENSNLYISNSSLAITNYSTNQEDGCNNCGKCLTGCPGNHIWSASKYFDATQFVVASVLRIHQESKKYRFDYLDSAGGIQSSPLFKYLIVACGSIQTSCLLINSDIAERAEISQNDMELVPFFFKSFSKIGGYERISLSEAFIWTEGSQDLFMQCYGMNKQILHKAFKKVSIVRLLEKWPITELLNRVGIAMVFKNSAASNVIAVSRESAGKCKIEEVKRSKSMYSAVKLKIRGLILLTFLKRRASTGESFHYGATKFYRDSESLEFDRNRGEFANLPNLIILDSSALPLLPSYPVTFTTMANAYGIIRRKFGVHQNE